MSMKMSFLEPEKVLSGDPEALRGLSPPPPPTPQIQWILPRQWTRPVGPNIPKTLWRTQTHRAPPGCPSQDAQMRDWETLVFSGNVEASKHGSVHSYFSLPREVGPEQILPCQWLHCQAPFRRDMAPDSTRAKQCMDILGNQYPSRNAPSI